MKQSLASRLSALYAALLGVTILIVIVASSFALVLELTNFTGDMVIAKHEEARIMAAQDRMQGISLKDGAPGLARSLGGIGMRVAVFDEHGTFLAGDKTLRPPVLDRVLRGRVQLPPPPGNPRVDGVVEFMRRTPPGPYHVSGPPRRPDVASLTAVSGGFVAFAPSMPLLLVSLIPYWRVVVTIAIIAVIISWSIGRVFARQSLRPLNDVTDSLHALADGDYTQRRFMALGGDEIGTLTAAYNDAAASVATVMEQRRSTEERMRQFVADAGHELRTPLTVIGGYIDVLRRGAIDEPSIARQILGTMAIEKEHMRTLIDRLMRLARLDSETPPRRDEIDVVQLLRGQVDAARRVDERRTIDYSVEGVSAIVGDQTELSDAVWNVVENALKYAPDAPIHLRAHGSNGQTVISVSDEGPGMTESERLHAFERFYRGDQRGEITGSGLGLAIAKRAVERAGGTIDLITAPAAGTTVTISLPNVSLQ